MKIKKSWQEALRAVNIPQELAVLALRSLGVSKTQIHDIYDLNELSLQQSLQDGLHWGKTSRPEIDLAFHEGSSEYEEHLFGMDELEELLKQNDVPFDHKKFEFEWTPFKPIYTYLHVEKGELVSKEVEPTRSHNRLIGAEATVAFFDQLREIFIDDSRLELFILLPRPRTGSKHHWDILTSKYEISNRNMAVRLLSCLSILGLSHGNSGHHTKYL